MLLVIDVGNSETMLGLYEGANLVAWWKLTTEAHRTADEYTVTLAALLNSRGVKGDAIKGMAVACVVPPLTPALREMAERFLKLTPVIVGPGVRTGIRILTDDPREVGPDRVACAVAARKLYGAPAIVVDFGTALVFDVISAKGDYIGNAIAPGVAIAAEALFHYASRLPRVELMVPPRIIGKNTVASIQAGTMYGYISLVEGMLSRLLKEVGRDAAVVATGSWAELFAPHIPLIEEVNPFLSLEGLRQIYELNVH